MLPTSKDWAKAPEGGRAADRTGLASVLGIFNYSLALIAKPSHFAESAGKVVVDIVGGNSPKRSFIDPKMVTKELFEKDKKEWNRLLGKEFSALFLGPHLHLAADGSSNNDEF